MKKLRKPVNGTSSTEPSISSKIQLAKRKKLQDRCGGGTGSWFPIPSSFFNCSLGMIIRIAGVIFICVNIIQNQDILELEIMNTMFMIVLAIVGLLFGIAFFAGLLSGVRLISIFVRTVADFSILSAAIYSLIAISAEQEWGKKSNFRLVVQRRKFYEYYLS